jgi:hypothetical protein
VRAKQPRPSDVSRIPVQAKLTSGHSADPLEREADRAGQFAERLTSMSGGERHHPEAHGTSRRAPRESQTSGRAGGRSLSRDLRRRMEDAFGADFGDVRLHVGPAAAEAADRIGAWAFTSGRDIMFSRAVPDPESAAHRALLGHELAHVVQQRASRAQPGRPQAAPRVTNIATSAAELGVGGRDMTATATVAAGAPASPALAWSINPGGVAPAGMTVVGTGRTVRIRAAQPPPPAVVGGAPFTVRAALSATPGDFFDSAPVMLVQVVSATYANAPALANVPSLIPGVFPPNSGEPNRDGIAGNTVTVNPVTAPAGRAATVAFRRSLGAAVAGMVVTPGRNTGDVTLRVTDNATAARLDETKPSAVVPAVPMATLVINAVPLTVNALTTNGAVGPYGVQNHISFGSSDTAHLPLIRIVGELITGLQDDFNLAPPNGAFNPNPLLALAVPANTWNDNLITPPMQASTVDARVAIDVNRFVGPGVPHLPRRVIYQQRFVYFSWQGGGAVFSTVMDTGRHRRSLIQQGANFAFTSEQIFPRASAPVRNEPYAGPPLIVLSNIVVTPTAAGATSLAADNTSTANVVAASTVAGRNVNWSLPAGGDAAFTAGNPAALPAAATLKAGNAAGRFALRAADTIYPNRRVDGNVRVAPVRLRTMRAVPSPVPPGTLSSAVTVVAEPGGRTVTWTVDAAATAAGVTVAPGAPGAGGVATATVTRPAAFNGTVQVTATDSVLAARTQTVSVRFR